MNKLKFIDLCHGTFGRQVAKTDVDRITRDNVVGVLASTIHVLNANRPLIKYLYEYYKGDQPINYRTKKVRPDINNKICENHALETVRFKTGQTYAEALQYVSKRKDSKINESVDMLNDYMEDAFVAARNIELGTIQSAVGTAYKAIAKDNAWKNGSDEIPFTIFIPDVLNTYIVYSSKNGKRMMSVQNLKDTKGESYYLIYSQDEWFKVKNGAVVGSGENWYEDIPIVEYPNNADRLSDIEICVTMFDAMNIIQSNRIDGIEQFIQAFMKFKNCEIDKDKFLEMCGLGAISVKDIGSGLKSDVDIISSELNQQQTQVAKDDLYRQMLIIEGMPDRQQNTGGDTGHAVYLRNGWDFAEKRALLDEPFIKESEKMFAGVVLKVLRKTTKDVDLSIRDFDVKITRNPTDNMLVKAQALDYLVKNKIHPLIAITTCGLFGDPQKVYEMSKKYMDELYTPEQQKQQIEQANKLLNQFASQQMHNNQVQKGQAE